MRRVLIVDDEPLVVDTLNLILSKSGFDVRSAGSTDEGLACARSFDPELVVCDLNMPGKDGFELISGLERDLPRCCILVLTGSYGCIPRAHERCGSIRQPMAVLTKPCQPADLLRHVDSMLLSA